MAYVGSTRGGGRMKRKEVFAEGKGRAKEGLNGSGSEGSRKFM